MATNWIEEANQNIQGQHGIMGFEEYMEIFEKHPLLELRPSYIYIKDALDFFGKSDNGQFILFQMEHADSPAVYGQHLPEAEIYQNLINFQEEGINNKFLLLVGPNGSAKTSILRKIMKGAEEYSKTSEGALYTFSWIFPIDNYIKGTLGLTSQKSGPKLNTFAHLDDKDIAAILNSELKDHPLLLIPTNLRKKIIEEKFKDHPDKLDALRRSYLYKGDLSKRNREIYDAMLKKYNGNHYDVLRHIRVERFFISRRYSSGSVTIEPQLHVDASMQQITMDKRLGGLPPSLQSMNLYSMQGEVILANRGMLEFSDLLKRPLDTFKYLLTTMETANINLNGILTELDIFFAGTSNEIHFSAFKQHPDYNSYKGRFNFIKVPYLLDYQEEEKIYTEQIEGLKDRSVLEPHTLSLVCLFSVMTRLRSSQAANYKDKKLSQIVMSLNPLEKALLLSDPSNLPDRFDSEAKSILKQSIEEIRNEYMNDELYEGKFGISPRDIKRLLYTLTSDHKQITGVEVLECLNDLILKKSEYDFLNMSSQGDFHNPERFITLLEKHINDIFDRELRSALGLVDDRSYEDYLKKYITNIKAKIKNEKIYNPITGKHEEINDYYVLEFETNIDLKENPEQYRSHLLSKLGAYSLDNPKKEIVYSEVFPELIESLKQSYRNEQKKVISNMAKNLVYFEAEKKYEEGDQNKDIQTPLSEDNRKQIQETLNNLKNKYHYTENGALTLIKNIIKDRY